MRINLLGLKEKCALPLVNTPNAEKTLIEGGDITMHADRETKVKKTLKSSPVIREANMKCDFFGHV